MCVVVYFFVFVWHMLIRCSCCVGLCSPFFVSAFTICIARCCLCCELFRFVCVFVVGVFCSSVFVAMIVFLLFCFCCCVCLRFLVIVCGPFCWWCFCVGYHVLFVVVFVCLTAISVCFPFLGEGGGRVFVCLFLFVSVCVFVLFCTVLNVSCLSCCGVVFV